MSTNIIEISNLDNRFGKNWIHRDLNLDIKKGEIILDYGKTQFQSDPSLYYFAICDENAKWKWAKVELIKNKLVLTHPEIPNPKYVRYAWADNPTAPFLYDITGYPAFPFRTDAFTTISKPKTK
jgi:hypothetical protein